MLCAFILDLYSDELSLCDLPPVLMQELADVSRLRTHRAQLITIQVKYVEKSHSTLKQQQKKMKVRSY